MSADDAFLTSPLLTREGFVHAFSTRLGGVSVGSFASMNLARNLGDDPEAVAENHRRFAARLGLAPDSVVETSQVHGDVVADVDDTTDPIASRVVEADALVARTAGRAVGVRTADCVPILIADPRTGLVAAVHAGWRGAVLGVVERAVERLGAYGATQGELLVAIGPHIGPDAFEVGEDVAGQIAESAADERVIVRGHPKPHVDLERVVRCALARSGVVDARVERVPGCTHDEAARFHSHRRDGRGSGRQLSAIVARVGSVRPVW